MRWRPAFARYKSILRMYLVGMESIGRLMPTNLSICARIVVLRNVPAGAPATATRRKPDLPPELHPLELAQLLQQPPVILVSPLMFCVQVH